MASTTAVQPFESKTGLRTASTQGFLERTHCEKSPLVVLRAFRDKMLRAPGRRGTFPERFAPPACDAWTLIVERRCSGGIICRQFLTGGAGIPSKEYRQSSGDWRLGLIRNRKTERSHHDETSTRHRISFSRLCIVGDGGDALDGRKCCRATAGWRRRRFAIPSGFAPGKTAARCYRSRARDQQVRRLHDQALAVLS